MRRREHVHEQTKEPEHHGPVATRTTPTTAPVAVTPTRRFSVTAVLSGAVVAIGIMFLLGAFVGLFLAGTETSAEDLARAGEIEAGVGAAIAFVLAQFAAYMWGGYTAGRMAGIHGMSHGLLVPIVAIVATAIVGSITAALGVTAALNLPFADVRLPLERATLVDLGIGVGILALAAMFAGAIVGGILGTRWHERVWGVRT